MNEIGNRVAARRQELGLSQTQLAKLVNVAQTTISKWERGLSQPSREETARLALALQVAVIELEGLTRGNTSLILPLMGYVGAGSRIYEASEDDVDFIEAPLGAEPGDCAFRIKGASMAPFSEGGLIVARPVGDMTQVLYRLAVVTLEDDRRFFKRVLPSSLPGHYTLARLDGDTEVRDVRVKAAALFKVYVEPN